MARSFVRSSISTERILEIYEKILPLISVNPEGVDVPARLLRLVRSFVPYDFWYYYIQDSWSPEEGLSTRSVKVIHHDHLEEAKIVVSTTNDSLEAILDQGFEQSRDRYSGEHPEHTQFDHYRIISNEIPRIGIGFGRHKEDNNAYTKEELACFTQLSPHILLLSRTVLSMKSEPYDYFRTLAHLGSHIARQFHFSKSEIKLLPDILAGLTNEEIADSHFISLSTVKSHVNHILKKTGSKNRADFISKFFTSPEQVQL